MRRCLIGEAFAETSVATVSSAAVAGITADNMIVVAATAASARESLFILPPLGSVRTNTCRLRPVPAEASNSAVRNQLRSSWSARRLHHLRRSRCLAAPAPGRALEAPRAPLQPTASAD